MSESRTRATEPTEADSAAIEAFAHGVAHLIRTDRQLHRAAVALWRRLGELLGLDVDESRKP
jgi:hypothetical protein